RKRSPPATSPLKHAEASAATCKGRPLPTPPATLMAAPQDYHTVGHLYRSIEHGFARLVGRHGEAGVFIGPPRAQASREVFGWPGLGAGTHPAFAPGAPQVIVGRGGGARGGW